MRTKWSTSAIEKVFSRHASILSLSLSYKVKSKTDSDLNSDKAIT